MENENVNKEMDLLDILKICWNWFVKYIWNTIVFLLKFAVNKWWVAIIAIILGLSAAYLYGTYNPRYTAHMILKSECVNSSDFISDFKVFAGTSPQYKSTAMNMPVELTNHIISIWPHAICYYDTTKTGYVIDALDEMIYKPLCPMLQNYFSLEVLVDDDSVFDAIEEGVLYYIKNNKYYVERLNRRKAALQSNMSLYPKIDDKIDSIANTYVTDLVSNSKEKGAGVLMSLDPKSYVNEKVRINDALVYTETELNRIPQIAVIVSPIKYKPLNANDWRLTYPGFVWSSLFGCYLIVLGVVYRKKLILFFKK